MSEFNLSKMLTSSASYVYPTNVYLEEDVKEFIRLLKEAINLDDRQYALEQLDKLAGEKLT